ncbi:hypothetical protein ETU08_08155 [Apibacter muscae]|uniref:BT4734/BF3469 family protein n=1 Tax=Apibacter muscae TaxID=2509004 RepID=UPI0011ABB770|nr:BT4734/BF3469 family protein [Apibacter muscae]TWP29247.1 hypothetical protein ETU08_08155 [Apibacter muscae]
MFQIIPAITNRRIIKKIPDLKALVDYVKSTEREEYPLIEQARESGKGSKEYDQIKKHQLPCVAINFNYTNNYIKGDNIDNPTGYLYIDIDNYETININKTYVCACWKSLSNNGYHIIVKVKGLTKDNYKEATKIIAESLDCPYDSAAISIDRITVLPYDPEAYYNNNTEVFDISYLNTTVAQEKVKEEKSIESIEKKFHSTNKEESLSLGYNYNGKNIINHKIRYDNLEEKKSTISIVYDEEGVCDLGENKLSYIQVFIPVKGKIPKGNRNSILSAITQTLIALNKNSPRNIIEKKIFTINEQKMQEPLPAQEVKQIIDKAYKNKDKLKLSPNNSKRFFFDESLHLTKEQKLSLVGIRMGRCRKEATREMILKVLEKWDEKEFGKITLIKMEPLVGKKKSCISNHLKEMGIDLKNPETYFKAI